MGSTRRSKVFQFGRLAFRILNDDGRDVGHFRDLDPKGLQARTRFHLIQKGQSTPFILLSRHVTILNAGHASQFMKVSRKDSQTSHSLLEIFGNGSSETVPIKGGRSTTQFINDDQTPIRGRPKNRRGFQHFGHEGTNATFLEIPRPDAGQDGMTNIDFGRGGGNIGSNLGETDNGPQRSNVRGFATHVRAGDEQEITVLTQFEIDIVGNEFDVILKFHTRVTSLLELWVGTNVGESVEFV